MRSHYKDHAVSPGKTTSLTIVEAPLARAVSHGFGGMQLDTTAWNPPTIRETRLTSMQFKFVGMHVPLEVEGASPFNHHGVATRLPEGFKFG